MKDPILEDLELLKPHPCLVQALDALRPPIIDPQLCDDEAEVTIQLERVVDIVHIVHDEGNDEEVEGPYLLELEESTRLIDSIARNADFIRLY